MNVEVSVIITTFKRSDLLPRAVDSALNQSYKNLEIIIVDDNEPDSQYRRDNEKLISTKYAGFCNVRYVPMERNSGACPARNKGVSEAQGEYINFLDDDDVLLPTKIEKQISVFQSDTKKELAAVGCFADIVNQNGEKIGSEEIEFKGDAFFKEMCTNLCTTSLALIRKDVYLKSGGFETMYSSQEHWMFMKLFSVLPGYSYVPETLALIYHHDGERISTNKRKPLGAVQLYNQSQKLINRFSKNEQSIIKASLNMNIIISYMILGDRLNAFKYLLKRQPYAPIYKQSTIKLLVLCIVGWDAYSKMSKKK